ncbi:MAG: polya polymerase [Eubacteriales bacterium]|nr:polya polymerase [Eubacteriales bacterium]
MRIKMYQIKETDKFMDIVNKSNSTIYLISDQGDRLNLKSTLTQYLALSSLFSAGEIKSMELEVDDQETAKELIDFMMTQN